MERKRAHLKRPTNVLSGLQQGAGEVFSGFKAGITGVFLTPYQGAKRGGVVGLLTGTVKGVAGLAIMPLSGIMGMASKTAQGIKSAMLSSD